MKVYRGFDNEIGPISHRHWIYVTPSIEHAKWYATKDGFVKNGSIIEYDMDKEHMKWISLSKINSFVEQYDEEYTENDLLWYQEDLANDLSQFKDGIVFQDPYDKNHTIYIVLNEKCLKNGRILSKEEFNSVKLRESFYENELNDVLRRAGIQLIEREDLTKFNRIAGFYNLKTKQFDLFPRTSEDISVEDDEVNDYIHNVQSKDEFTEFNIVRFGIEDIPGEGVVCYIEGDTKRNVEKCYYAILEKYAEECDIIKYELEYYVGNEHKYIFLDRYGKQIMESLNESVIRRDDGEIGGYYTQSISDLLNIINNKYRKDDIRVLYDIDKKLYMFADTYSAIHFNLILYMILYTNVYDNISEIKNNKYESDEVLQDIIKSKLYLASFKIFRNYGNDSDEEFINFLRNIPENTTDGYAYGFTCKINDNLWAICRDDEIGEAKQVPLLQNKTWINLNDNNY